MNIYIIYVILSHLCKSVPIFKDELGQNMYNNPVFVRNDW